MKTAYKSLGLRGGIFGAVPYAVDVKDGKIVRIRPLHFDSKYDAKTFNPYWGDCQGWQVLEAPYAVPCPFSLAYKKRSYSPTGSGTHLERMAKASVILWRSWTSRTGRCSRWTLQHTGYLFLHRGFHRSDGGARNAGDLQFQPRQAVCH